MNEIGDHIDNRRLYEAVYEAEILEPNEIEHLSACEECLELIRMLVHQKAKSAEVQ
jgi:hypothetical protein